MEETKHPTYLIRLEAKGFVPTMVPSFRKNRIKVIKGVTWLMKHGPWEKAEIWNAYELKLMASLTK